MCNILGTKTLVTSSACAYSSAFALDCELLMYMRTATLCSCRSSSIDVDAIPHDADDLRATETWEAAIGVVRIDVRWKTGSCYDCSNASFYLDWVHSLKCLLLAGLCQAPALQWFAFKYPKVHKHRLATLEVSSYHAGLHQ